MTLIKARSRGINLADDFAFTGTITGAGGIQHAELFRLSAQLTGEADPITGFVTTSGVDSQGRIGSGMSESSGVFTFPSTGIYYVTFSAMSEANSLTNDMFNQIIQAEIGNGYNDTAYGQSSINNIGSAHGMECTINTIVDITNTSTCKVRFVIENAGSDVFIHGSTNRRHTYATFIRLGDT